jgi:hypothetical protein
MGQAKLKGATRAERAEAARQQGRGARVKVSADERNAAIAQAMAQAVALGPALIGQVIANSDSRRRRLG